jgi:hypothetical protein
MNTARRRIEQKSKIMQTENEMRPIYDLIGN